MYICIIIYLLWLDFLHDTDSLDDQLDSRWRSLQCPHFNHVTFVE